MTMENDLVERLLKVIDLLAAEDVRQSKIHDLLETIREQIRLEVKPECRPDGLFTNIQNAVYAMRGRTRLLDDVAIVEPPTEAAGRIQALEAELVRKTEALPDLSSVISWLENGCDPKNGAKELRIYAARIAAALEEKTDV